MIFLSVYPHALLVNELLNDFSFVSNKQFYHEPVIADMESNKFQS